MRESGYLHNMPISYPLSYHPPWQVFISKKNILYKISQIRESENTLGLPLNWKVVFIRRDVVFDGRPEARK
jgi:hypothetical protein